MYAKLPGCLDELEYALQNSTVETRAQAQKTCTELATGDLHGTVLIDIRKKVIWILPHAASVAHNAGSVSQRTRTITLATQSHCSG